MLSENKRVDFIVEIFDGFYLRRTETIDSYDDAVNCFHYYCDKGFHCIIYRSEVMSEFFPDHLNFDWHAPLILDKENEK